MAKYHGNGNPDSPIVQLQLHQITQDFARSRNDNPWWDFRELGNTRAARYRTAMVIAMAFFGQWSGNNVVNFFMPAMVRLPLRSINPLLERTANALKRLRMQAYLTPISNSLSPPSTLYSLCSLLSTALLS
jgi:hypothetical protein